MGILRGEFTRGEFDGWEFSGGSFPGGGFTRTVSEVFSSVLATW